MHDVEVEVVVPDAVEAGERLDDRDVLLGAEEPHHAIVGRVGGDDVVDRLEHGAVEILHLARRAGVDGEARGCEHDRRAAFPAERDQLAIGLGVAALHQRFVRQRRRRRRRGHVAGPPRVERRSIPSTARPTSAEARGRTPGSFGSATWRNPSA